MSRYYKLSEELGDGQSPQIVANLDEMLTAITDWFAYEVEPGEGFEVEVVEMAQAEFEALPEL